MNSSGLTRSRRYIILMALGATVPAVVADETTAKAGARHNEKNYMTGAGPAREFIP
jgi:hypothetical protein